MLFKTLSMLIALTVTAAFFGWVKSTSKTVDTARLDESLSYNSLMAGKKTRINRRHVADALP
ncbi:hypothetical protein EBU99_09740 [bacterium]|nr:hypothetical protein [bacterium]